jgi:signal transduction histidine kinase
MGWFLPFAMVLLLFPDGRPPTRGLGGRPSPCPLSVVAFNLLLAVVPWAADAPPGRLAPPVRAALGRLRLPSPRWSCSTPHWSRPRWRRGVATGPRADELERARLRWMFLPASASRRRSCCAGRATCSPAHPIVALGGLVAMNVAIPAATLVAMLRHDLYDVDKAVVAAAVYPDTRLRGRGRHAVLSAAVALALGADSTAPRCWRRSSSSSLLLPARALLLRVLGRRLHPRRARASRPSGRSSATCTRATTNRSGSSPCCARAARPGLRVGYRRPGSADFVDVDGGAVSGTGVPIRLKGNVDRGDRPGVRGACSRRGRARGRLLLAESTRLRGELVQALGEVEASRRRLLRAGYEERRRLEMDLHDGAQQRLVSLGMRLRVAQHRSPQVGRSTSTPSSTPPSTRSPRAVAELRQIAHGLRPSCLDDGLAPPWRA